MMSVLFYYLDSENSKSVDITDYLSKNSIFTKNKQYIEENYKNYGKL